MPLYIYDVRAKLNWPVVRCTATCSGDHVTSKLNVGTGKTGHTRTREHLTRTRPDP